MLTSSSTKCRVHQVDQVLPAPPQNTDQSFNRRGWHDYYTGPLPEKVELRTKIVYDRTLLDYFHGDHMWVEDWLDQVVVLSRPLFTHHSLKIKVELIVEEGYHFENIRVRANEFHLKQLGDLNQRFGGLVSVFAADICQGHCMTGIARIGTACNIDGHGISISELWQKLDSEYESARTFVHELGHNIGMLHDFDKKHKGNGDFGGPCDGLGLMSYNHPPDQWSYCSNGDFVESFRSHLHGCLKESDPRPRSPPGWFHW